MYPDLLMPCNFQIRYKAMPLALYVQNCPYLGQTAIVGLERWLFQSGIPCTNAVTRRKTCNDSESKGY